MKKQLLFGCVLLMALSSYSQNNSSDNSTSTIISSVFTRFSGSMNVYSVYKSNAKPLQYNRYLSTYSFIQRKSATYVTNPVLNNDAQSGAVVMYLGKNDGANWDSTLVYADNNNWGRYPTGGLYVPPNATSFSQAYAIGSGACDASSLTWTGSWRTSKLIGAAGTNSVGTDVQFFSNTGFFGSTTSPFMTKHDQPSQSFSSTEDGIVRVAGILNTDPNAITYNTSGFRGAHISKGVFASGVMVWTSDSMVPPFIQRTDGSNQASTNNVYMAWNDQGTVGYVMMIGARAGSTLQNKSWQPIVYKTTNSGSSWVLISGIDFNASTTMYDKLLNSIGAVNNTSVTAPYFKVDEGIDMVVDNSGKLHIVGLAVGCASAHQDSLETVWQYTVNGQPLSEKYSWTYKNTKWPYLFDFTGDGTGLWSMTIIDSLGTEVPGKHYGYPGFTSNPWASMTETNTINSDARVQVSRTYDGQFLVYSWAETDTSINTGFYKWNEHPNIHQRALRLCDGAVSTDEFLISSPTTGINARVRDNAYFHYMGSTCKAGGSTLTQATFTVPYTVTNNAAYISNNPVDNYFASAIVTHHFPSSACGATVTTGFNSTKTEASQSIIYPNPTKNNFNIAITLTKAQDIFVDVYDAIGQMISSVKSNCQMGENVINISLNNAIAGIYFVKIKSGTSESIKKLVIE